MKFKKCISLLLVVLLLVSNTGLAFNVHFCGGAVASVSLKTAFSKADKSCCGMKVESSHCCKSKVVHFQKKSDNTVVKGFAFQTDVALPMQMNTTPILSSVPVVKNESVADYYCDANAPPLYQLYSQYIFYDRF